MFVGTSGSADLSAAKCNCGAGSYYNGSACASCPAGQYSSRGIGDMSTSCSDCAAGTYALSTGASSCSDCTAGKFSSSTGRATACTDSCSAGKFSASGASSCSDCAAGKYAASMGSTTCSDCDAGEVSSALGDTCESASSSQKRSDSWNVISVLGVAVMSCFFFGLSILLCRRQTARANAKTRESTEVVEIGTMPGGLHDATDDHSKGVTL